MPSLQGPQHFLLFRELGICPTAPAITVSDPIITSTSISSPAFKIFATKYLK
jgi:hypothetical protein